MWRDVRDYSYVISKSHEFSIVLTSGERERVPFMPHDNFVGGSEAVGRILVKGYVSISYFPTFFSKVFLYIHTCIHTYIFI